MNPTIGIIEKWYKKLNFPSSFDAEFYECLQRIDIPESTDIETYDREESDGKRNLLSFLYMCEALEKRYLEAGISSEILLDTLGDLVRWTEIWSELKNELYLGQLTWVSWHMRMKLFKIGRLQFAMQKADHDIPELGLRADDDIIGIHIPSGEPLRLEDCQASIDAARVFFKVFYPSYRFEYFTCHTWLLDSTLEELLEAGSNILNFRNLFDHISHETPSDALLGYVFQWMAKREDVMRMTPSSTLAKKVLQHIHENGEFHEAIGAIKK